MEKKWIINDERSRRIALAKAKTDSFRAAALRVATAEKLRKEAADRHVNFVIEKAFEDKERNDMLQRKIKYNEEQDMKQARIDNNYAQYVQGKQLYRSSEITPKHQWLNSYANDDWRPNKRIKWSDGWSPYQQIRYSADPLINDKLNSIDKELTRKTEVFNQGKIRKSVFDQEVGQLKREFDLVKNIEKKAYEDKLRTINYNKTRNFFLKK